MRWPRESRGTVIPRRDSNRELMKYTVFMRVSDDFPSRTWARSCAPLRGRTRWQPFLIHEPLHIPSVLCYAEVFFWCLACGFAFFSSLRLPWLVWLCFGAALCCWFLWRLGVVSMLAPFRPRRLYHRFWGYFMVFFIDVWGIFIDVWGVCIDI